MPSYLFIWSRFYCSPWPRLLGVRFSSDLSLDRHVSTVSASTCSFYWLRQLRGSRCSLDAASSATLVHAFVSSCIDYCNAVLAGSPKVTTGRLQWVLNAAVRVVSGTQKYDRGLSWLLHTELHWLDVPKRVKYKLSIMVLNCLNGQAPQYLIDFLIAYFLSNIFSKLLSQLVNIMSKLLQDSVPFLIHTGRITGTLLYRYFVWTALLN